MDSPPKLSPQTQHETPFTSQISTVITELQAFCDQSDAVRSEYQAAGIDSDERKSFDTNYEKRRGKLLEHIEAALGTLVPVKEAETIRKIRTKHHTYNLSLIEGLQSLKGSLKRGSQEDEMTPILLEASLEQLRVLRRHEVLPEVGRGEGIVERLKDVAPSAALKLAAITGLKVGGVVAGATAIHLGLEKWVDAKIGPEQINESPQILSAIGILVALSLANSMVKRGNTDTAVIETLGELNAYVLKITDLINNSDLELEEKEDKIELLAHFAANFGFNLHERTTTESSAPLDFEVLSRSLVMIEQKIVKGLSETAGVFTEVDIRNTRVDTNKKRNALASISSVRLPKIVKQIISGSALATIGVVTAYQGPAVMPALTTATILLFSRLGNEIDQSILAESLTALPIKKRVSDCLLRINQILQIRAEKER